MDGASNDTRFRGDHFLAKRPSRAHMGGAAKCIRYKHDAHTNSGPQPGAFANPFEMNETEWLSVHTEEYT